MKRQSKWLKDKTGEKHLSIGLRCTTGRCTFIKQGLGLIFQSDARFATELLCHSANSFAELFVICIKWKWKTTTEAPSDQEGVVAVLPQAVSNFSSRPVWTHQCEQGPEPNRNCAQVMKIDPRKKSRVFHSEAYSMVLPWHFVIAMTDLWEDEDENIRKSTQVLQFQSFLMNPKWKNHVPPHSRKGPSFHLRKFLSYRKHVTELGRPGMF